MDLSSENRAVLRSGVCSSFINDIVLLLSTDSVLSYGVLSAKSTPIAEEKP
jgi:hypothetical protein